MSRIWDAVLDVVVGLLATVWLLVGIWNVAVAIAFASQVGTAVGWEAPLALAKAVAFAVCAALVFGLAGNAIRRPDRKRNPTP